MPTIFRQHSAVSCFYCLSNVYPLPRNPLHFLCPYCGCWNRYDSNGEILSEEAAMHEESLNTRSFAKRASPRKDRLPTTYGGTRLCHSCQTNQMLLTQLLSKYLPPPEDPNYECALERLPEYKRSIEMRYPPVCENCEPLVEEAIRKGDQMARVRALGGALKTTQGTDNKRRSSSSQKAKDKLERELRMWKLRGCIWACTLFSAIAGYSSIAASYRLFTLPSYIPAVIPFLLVISVFWTAWDPTYAMFRRSQFQGRAIRIHGKKQYIILQILAWMLRMMTAVMLYLSRFKPEFDPMHLWDEPYTPTVRVYCSVMLACEVVILMCSVLVLYVQYPPPVRLVDTKSHLRQSSAAPSGSSTRHSTPVVAGPDLFAALSISNKPVSVSQNPIFGIPSLQTAAPPSTATRPNGITPRPPGMDVDMDDDDQDQDAMDVDSTSPVKKPRREHDDDGAWLRPQRFFAPEEPTGLENLFAQTIRLADTSESLNTALPGGTARSNPEQRPASPSLIRDWRTWFALAIIPLSAIGYKAWDVHKQNTRNPVI